MTGSKTFQILRPSVSPLPSREPQTAVAQQKPISKLIVGYRAAKVLFTAVSVDLFEQFRYGSRSATSVAESLQWDVRACEIFLNALVAMDVLKKTNRGYSNTDFAAENLLKDGAKSLYHNLRFQDIAWECWSQLGGVLKNHGRKDLVRLIADRRFVNEYIHGMKEIARQSAPEVARILSATEPQAFLDVGAGSGSYSCALLEACPSARAVLLDLPSTLKITQQLTESHKDRIRLVRGDYHKVSFGKSDYDVVLLSHITHDEGEMENRRLVAKAVRALRPGGVVAIHDFMLEESGTKPLFPALFSLQMLVYTRRGKTYTRAECEGWLRRAGLRRLEIHRICPGAENESALLLGYKL